MVQERLITHFWKSFGVPAYDENSVPDNAALPRITYNLPVDFFDRSVSLTASIWARGDSWATVTGIKDLVTEMIGRSGTIYKYDEGVAWIKPSTPYAQRMSDTDPEIRRIVLNLEAEFLT